MTKARKIIEAGRILIIQGKCRPLKFMMHTCAERKMLPYWQPARGAAARSASLELKLAGPGPALIETQGVPTEFAMHRRAERKMLLSG